jgi:branched-chain amino acid transport system permease protein
MPSFLRGWQMWGVGLVLAAVAALAPLFLLDRFTTLEWAYVWLFAIAIVGLNILTGYSGQISLGNGAFMAIGAYVTAILVHDHGWPYLATIPLAGLVAGVGGFLFGIPALKLSGIYLALATFTLAIATGPFIKHYGTITHGHEGIVLQQANDPTGAGLTSEQWVYYLCLVIAIVLFLFARAVTASRTGRAWRAIRDSETAAAASGISLAYYKTLAFAISALFAGVAGSLDAIVTAYVSPDSFDLPLSLGLLVGAVVGGLGTVVGPWIGAGWAIWLPYFSQRVKFNGQGIKPDIAYGVILILLMFVMPQGVVGGFWRLWGRFRGTRRAEESVEVLDKPAPTPEAEATPTAP